MPLKHIIGSNRLVPSLFDTAAIHTGASQLPPAAPALLLSHRCRCSLLQPPPPLLLCSTAPAPAPTCRLQLPRAPAVRRPGAALQLDDELRHDPPSHDEPRRGQVDDGIDPKNACKIEIDVTSFRTVEDGQSVYHKGRVLEWWVDSEEYSIIDMEKDVLQHYCWASNQEANFWSEMNVCDDNLEIVHEMNELQIDPRIESEMQIIVRDEDPLVEAVDLEWAEEPQHGVTTAGPERVEEEEKEHYMDPGFDAEGDDPLGADEEWRYFKKKASG
ncbi:hypothetical protein EJB05_05337, partial [Eragrostis curvula]